LDLAGLWGPTENNAPGSSFAYDLINYRASFEAQFFDALDWFRAFH
jgi:hypothetical protein